MKVGLKETLSLLAAGYKKKDIDAMIAADEEEEKKEPEVPAPVITDSAPVQEEKKEEPDYKKMYEELLEQNKKTEAKVTKLQQDNIHKDSAPASAEAKQKEQEALTELVRGFM